MASKQNLLHGQTVSIQWVAHALKKMSNDIEGGGLTTSVLLGNTTSAVGKKNFKALEIGCHYSINFLLPFAIELALKALLRIENINYGYSHNLLELYNKLSADTKIKLSRTFSKIVHHHEDIAKDGFIKTLSDNQNNFVEWRYLEKPEILKKDERILQFIISTILEVYDGIDSKSN